MDQSSEHFAEQSNLHLHVPLIAQQEQDRIEHEYKYKYEQEQEIEYSQSEESSESVHVRVESSEESIIGMSMPPLLKTCILYLLGVGLLVPWNAFISAKPYFSARLCGEVELWFGLVYNISAVLSLAALMTSNWLCSSKKETNNNNESSPINSHSPYWMVMLPLSIYLSVFALTAVLVFIPTLSTELFFLLTLLSIGTCGSMVAVASAGMVATASHLDGVGPLFSGQAVGGVVVAVVNFGSSWLGESIDDFWHRTCAAGRTDRPDQHLKIPVHVEVHVDVHADVHADCPPMTHVDWAVVSYFGVGCLILACCLVGYHLLYQASHSQEYDRLEDVELSVESSPRFIADLELERQRRLEENMTMMVWKDVNQPGLAIFLNLLVTLSLFPAWTASLRSTQQCQSHSRVWNDLFTPLTFVWFNVLDLAGRLLAEKYSYLLDHSKLVPYALSRFILFLPFAMLPTSHMHQSITPIQSDIFSFLMQAVFALSNGFVLSWSFLLAPTLIPPKNEAIEIRSSEILNFCLNMGLLSGSLLSFVYSEVAAS